MAKTDRYTGDNRVESSMRMVPGRAMVTEYAVFAVAGIHLFVGLFLINRLSLWGDEAFTAETVRLSTADLLSMMTHIDVNMSGYYLVLHAWTALFGTSEISLRLPSLLMTTATTLIAARLVTRWFGSIPGLITAIALGFSPYLLLVGLTARPFAMLGLVYVLSVGCFVEALGKRSLAPWLVLALINLLALYTSLLAVLFIATEAGYLLVIDRRIYRAHGIAAAVFILGAMPTVVFLAPNDTLNWLAAADIPGVFSSVYSFRLGIILAGLVLAGLVLWPRVPQGQLARLPSGRMLLPGLLVGQLLIMVALLPKQTLFTPPYLVTVFVASAMLAGAVFVTFQPPVVWAVGGVLTATLMLSLVVHLEPQPGFENQDWRTATALLDAIVQPNDTVIFPNTFYRIAGEHYERNGGFIKVANPALPSTPWFSQVPYEYDRLKRTEYYRDVSRVTEGLGDTNRVWTVGPDDGFMAFADAALAQAGWTMANVQHVAGISVELWTHH